MNQFEVRPYGLKLKEREQNQSGWYLASQMLHTLKDAAVFWILKDENGNDLARPSSRALHNEKSRV